MWTATMSPTTVTSGTVNFFSDGVLLGTGTVGAAHTATFRPASSVNLPAGTHNIVAVYAGNATFNSSTSAAFVETFNKATTTISLTVKNSGTYGQTFILSGILGSASVIAATPPSGTITFFDGATAIGSPVPITVVPTASGGLGLYQGQLLQPLSGGTHTITAQLTDNNYNAATSNSQTITVSPASQAISFPAPITTVTYGATAPIALSATSSSGLAVSYSVSGPATVSGSTLIVTGPGTIIVTANQVGNANYTAATPVPRTIVSKPAGFIVIVPSTQAQGTSSTVTVTLTASSSFTLGSLSVTSAGAPGTPFTIISGGSCIIGNSYSLGDACTVTLNFTPTGPGLITGTVQGLDTSGTPVLEMVVNATAVRYR
jgi:uncharacterized membrane protein